MTDESGPCCEFHGRNCEPPSELCCWQCTEVNHPNHEEGQPCSAPDLSYEPSAREVVACPFCGSAIGQPCIFPAGEAWTVVEDGVTRRTVHAARYAQTLPANKQAEFWKTAVHAYISSELAALSDTAPDRGRGKQ